MEDPVVVSQYVVRPGPHYPPLTHRCPRPLIPAPCPPSREEVYHKILQACFRHRCRDILVLSLATRLLKVHVQVTRNNQLRPSRPLRHCLLHVSNRRPVSWRQVTSDNVPAPLPRPQLARDEVCAKLVYSLDCEGGVVPI